MTPGRSASTVDGAKSGPTGAQRDLRRRYLAMDLLRLITCGSVDDGKSTLIGRLLHDSKSIHEDQWEAIHRTSLRRGDQRVDLALLTDGLRAEREQAITIDVAYRYFSTPRRKFILADTPGHVQYTRNMVTGASTADCALILVDARQGILEQTRRHAYLVALLGIRHLVLCVNKMDLVGWDEAVFAGIVRDFSALTAPRQGVAHVFDGTEATAIPLCALDGDNVVERSARTPWHRGPALLEHLERLPPRVDDERAHPRFPVQWVIRPHGDDHHDYRGYAGRMAAGRFRVGDEVVALPGGQRSRIARIELVETLSECRAPQSATILLEHDLDISRGDLLVGAHAEAHATLPTVARELDATLVWMNATPLRPGGRYVVKHGTRSLHAILGPVASRLDVATLAPLTDFPESPAALGLNDIGDVHVRLASPIAFDPYARCRETGAFIVIDEGTNETVGAGLILG